MKSPPAHRAVQRPALVLDVLQTGSTKSKMFVCESRWLQGPQCLVHCSGVLKGAIFKAAFAVIVPDPKDLPHQGGWEIGRGQAPASATQGETKHPLVYSHPHPPVSPSHISLMGSASGGLWYLFYQLTLSLREMLMIDANDAHLRMDARGGLKPWLLPRHPPSGEEGLCQPVLRSGFCKGRRCPTALYLHLGILLGLLTPKR